MRIYAPLPALLSGVVLLSAFCFRGDGQAGEQNVTSLILESPAGTKTVAAPVRSIQAGAPETIPAAPVEPNREYFRPFGDYRQDSRNEHTLPSGSWEVRWKAPLETTATPVHLMQGGDRIIMQGGDWRIFDRDGKLIVRNRAAAAPMAADDAHQLLYAINTNAYFVAYKLQDGKPAFDFPPAFGDAFSRVFLARKGRRVAIAGFERQLDPHRNKKPERSNLEVVDLGDPPKADDLGFLSTMSQVGSLRFPEPRMVAAASNDVIVTARTDYLYVMDWNLAVRAVLESGFTPVAISLDEAGRIYLLSQTGRRYSLTLLKQNGARIYSYDLTDGIVPMPVPPIIGHDHTVYLLSSARISAIGENGKPIWAAKPAAAIGGAVITAGGTLLVSEGSEIAAYDPAGARTVVFKGADALITPPLLTTWGDLLVGSKPAIYCLTAGGAK